MMAKTNVSIFLRSNRIINAVCQIRHNLSIKRSKEFFKEFFLDLPTLIRGFEFRPRNLGRRVSGWLPNFRCYWKRDTISREKKKESWKFLASVNDSQREGIFSRERYRENNGPINVPNVRNLLLYSVSRGSVQPDDHLPAGGGRKRETK